MADILKAVLFGIVEGITEWLPVSSTGHMILLDQFVHLNVSGEFYKLFEVVIQLGAIMAVVLLFWQQLWPFCFYSVKEGREKGQTGVYAVRRKFGWKPGSLELWIKIIAACIPAAVIGVLFDDKIDELFYHPIPVAAALITVGIAFIVVEKNMAGHKPAVDCIRDLTYRDVIIIGLFQVLAAVFPGTSRSGATIIGAIMIGISRTVAAEFTFYLAVPVMFGASLLKLVKFMAGGFAVTANELLILVVGTTAAFAVSVFVIRGLMTYIKRHDFRVFGYYRIVLGLLVILILH